MIEINNIYHEDCLDTMARMPDCFVDLTVTSPPYDKLRAYNGYCFDFEQTAIELFRITKNGGVVVWVVGDQTINGGESGTSFRQALFFQKIGFQLYDTMIYEKSGMSFPSPARYYNIFEYMFVLSKGKPSSVNLIKDRENKYIGKTGGNHRGGLCNRKKFGTRFNIWRYKNGGNLNSAKDKIAFKHPAIFPEQLAEDHIISWSKEADLIYDPFLGSGTTAKMAKKLNRNYIGSEISEEYINICLQRLK